MSGRHIENVRTFGQTIWPRSASRQIDEFAAVVESEIARFEQMTGG